jgi:CDGSH-type Zn-finger protein
MPVSEILAAKNGPYRMVGGKITTIDAQGNEMEIEKPRVSLCRCGHSATKPFCDGTHKTCGYVADEIIVRWGDEP